MYFLAKTNKIIIGITITLDAAIKSSCREPASVVKAWSPYGKVLERLSDVMYKGHIKEFHEESAFNKTIVNNEGFAKGTITRHK